MSQATGRTHTFLLAGTALVAVGVWLLAERVLGPVFGPLDALLHVVGALAWPLALIALGVALLGRGRFENGVGGVFRSRSERIVGGVLGGVAIRLGTDPWVVRVTFLAVALMTGLVAAAMLYIAALMLLPEERALVTEAPPAPPIPGAATTTP